MPLRPTAKGVSTPEHGIAASSTLPNLTRQTLAGSGFTYHEPSPNPSEPGSGEEDGGTVVQEAAAAGEPSDSDPNIHAPPQHQAIPHMTHGSASYTAGARPETRAPFVSSHTSGCVTHRHRRQGRGGGDGEFSFFNVGEGSGGREGGASALHTATVRSTAATRGEDASIDPDTGRTIRPSPDRLSTKRHLSTSVCVYFFFFSRYRRAPRTPRCSRATS